jgi:starvation-inducible DNA-binding protein
MSANKAAEKSDHTQNAKAHRVAPLGTPTDLGSNAIKDISGALNALLSDVFSLYMKTKNFHWHMSGPHFRDYHLMLDEQSQQIFAMTDPMAERVRKLGCVTLHSIGEIARKQRLKDNDAEFVTPHEMLAELRDDNKQMVAEMREVHDLCDENKDVATASLLEVWIDETERRTWFLFEAGRAE